MKWQSCMQWQLHMLASYALNKQKYIDRPARRICCFAALQSALAAVSGTIDAVEHQSLSCHLACHVCLGALLNGILSTRQILALPAYNIWTVLMDTPQMTACHETPTMQ